jgi:hypothetical protein
MEGQASRGKSQLTPPTTKQNYRTGIIMTSARHLTELKFIFFMTLAGGRKLISMIIYMR